MTTAGKAAYPAVRYAQGERTVYGFFLDFAEAGVLLPRRLPEDFEEITGNNRAIAPKRLSGIKNYLKDAPGWSLQPLTIALPQEAVEYGQATNRLKLKLEESSIRVVDGQHRRQAIHDLLDEKTLDEGKPAQDWSKEQTGVTLYVEDDPKRTKQMFSGMGNAEPADRATRLRFNTRDCFNNINQTVETESSLVRGRVNPKKTTTATGRDEFLMTSEELRDIVTVLTTGRTISAPKPGMLAEYGQEEKQDEVTGRTVRFLDEFLPRLHSGLDEIAAGEMSLVKISLRRQENALLYPQVILFIAHCCQAAGESEDERKALSGYLQEQDFNKHENAKEKGTGILDRLELINRGKAFDGQLKLLAKRDPRWATKAREVLKAARTPGEDSPPVPEDPPGEG